MAEMRQDCHCDKCGNEAEMTVTCEWVDIKDESGVTTKKQKETRVCTVCGNEADMIIDLEED